MLNLKALFTKYLQSALFKSGGTLGGDTYLSVSQDNSYNAVGYYSSSSTTVSALYTETAETTGCFGSASISSTSTAGSVMFTTGSYRFIQPTQGFFSFQQGGHRLFHTAVSQNSNTSLVVNHHKLILTSKEVSTSSSSSGFAQYSNSYYSLNLNSCVYGNEGPNLRTITLYINCTTPASSFTRMGTVPFTCAGPATTYFTLTNTAGTTMTGYINGTNLYACGGYAGHGFKGTVTYFCPRS